MANFLDSFKKRLQNPLIMYDEYGGADDGPKFFDSVASPVRSKWQDADEPPELVQNELVLPTIAAPAALPSYRDQEMAQLAERTRKSNEEFGAIHDRYKKANDDYATAVAAVPQREKPNIWRSILAGAVGGAIGYSGRDNLAATIPRAMQVGEAIQQRPFNNKLEDWQRGVGAKEGVVKATQKELDTYGELEGRRMAGEGRMEAAKIRTEGDLASVEQRKLGALANELKFMGEREGNAFLEDGLSPQYVASYLSEGGRRVASAAYPGKFILVPSLADRDKLVNRTRQTVIMADGRREVAAGNNTSREKIADKNNKTDLDIAKIRTNAAALRKTGSNYPSKDVNRIRSSYLTQKSALVNDLLNDTKYQTMEAKQKGGIPLTPEESTYFWNRKRLADIRVIQANNSAKQEIEFVTGQAPFEYGRVLRATNDDPVADELRKMVGPERGEELKQELNNAVKLPPLTWKGISTMPGWAMRRLNNDENDPMIEVKRIGSN